MGKFWLIKLG